MKTFASLLTGAAIVTAAAMMPSFAQTMSMPVHGNWCGLGHGNNYAPRPPVDPLDESCMKHDICTLQRGRFNCGCDILFMQDLRRIRWPNPGFEAKARAIHDAIAVVPCTDPSGQANKIEMLMSDWLTGVLSGRESPWEIFMRWGHLGLDGMDRSMRDGFNR